MGPAGVFASLQPVSSGGSTHGSGQASHDVRGRTKGCGASFRGPCWKPAPSLGCQAVGYLF